MLVPKVLTKLLFFFGIDQVPVLDYIETYIFQRPNRPLIQIGHRETTCTFNWYYFFALAWSTE